MLQPLLDLADSVSLACSCVSRRLAFPAEDDKRCGCSVKSDMSLVARAGEDATQSGHLPIPTVVEASGRSKSIAKRTDFFLCSLPRESVAVGPERLFRMDSSEVADAFDAWRCSGAVDLVIEFLYAGLFPVVPEHMVCGLDWLRELKEVKSDRRGLTVEDGKFDF
jgi:hypothetical protein